VRNTTIAMSYGKVMTVREGYEVRVTVNCVACDFAVFEKWSAPGHLFHGSDQRQESFIVSGDASISLVPKSVLPTTICIPPSRFNENFTLSVEGRGTSVDPYYAGEVFMGHEVTSPPNEPVLVSYEYTGPQLPPLILSPGGYKSQDSSGHTCNYETEVWLAKKEVLNELYPRLDIMEHETVTHIATSNVGWPVIRNGALFTDNHDDFLGSVTLAQQPVDPVTGCRTSPGIMSWLYDIVEIPIGYSYFGNDAQIDCASGRVTVEHKFKPMLTLTLESKGEQGYAVASPAKKYYAEPFEANPDYEEVTITARPLPGFGFTHWEGDIGGATISGVKGEIITVTMDKDRSVVPCFVEENRAALTAIGGDLDFLEEGETQEQFEKRYAEIHKMASYDLAPLSSLNYCVESIDGSDKQGPEIKEYYLQNLPEFNVLRFAGHGIAVGAIRISNRDANSPIHSALLTSEVPSACNYSLVVLHSCGQGGYATQWQSAFNAKCFIGWTSSPTWLGTHIWDEKFWPLVVEKGKSASLAAIEVQQYVIKWIEQNRLDADEILTVSPMHIITIGDVILSCGN